MDQNLVSQSEFAVTDEEEADRIAERDGYIYESEEVNSLESDALMALINPTHGFAGGDR